MTGSDLQLSPPAMGNDFGPERSSRQPTASSRNNVENLDLTAAAGRLPRFIIGFFGREYGTGMDADPVHFTLRAGRYIDMSRPLLISVA